MANQNTPLGQIKLFSLSNGKKHMLLRPPLVAILCLHLVGIGQQVEIALTSNETADNIFYLETIKTHIDKAGDSLEIAADWLKRYLGKPDISPQSLRPIIPQPMQTMPYTTEKVHLVAYHFQGVRPSNPNLFWVDLPTANIMCEDGRITDFVTYFAIKMYILDRPNKT